MTWNDLKNTIYNWDGSLLDIYIQNTTSQDWETWVSIVNKKFKINWYNGVTDQDCNSIDFSVIKQFWSGKTDLTSTAVVHVGNTTVKAHFFTQEEIENDIDPREFKSIEDHNNLIDYLKELSKKLNKEVIVTPEDYSQLILIKVNGNKVEINLK